MRLESLQVRSFRGIPHGDLPFGGNSIVLGGGNGTGKTGFVDAMEFLFTGTVRPLTGIAGLSLRAHLPHVGSPPKDASVSGEFAGGATATRTLAGLDAPPSLLSLFQRGPGVAFILRRSQLQEFIHAKPADRYRRLADLIGADELDRTEVALKRSRDTLSAGLTASLTRLADIDRMLAAVPAVPSDGDLLAETNRQLERISAGRYRLESLDGLGNLRAEVLRDARGEERQATERLNGELERGLSFDRLQRALSSYLDLSARWTAPERAHLLDLLQLLRSGRDYIRHTGTDRCPLCERDADIQAMLGRLAKRVAQLEEVSLRQEEMERARADIDMALQYTAARALAVRRALNDARVQAPIGPVSDVLSMLGESLRTGGRVELTEVAGRLTASMAAWSTWLERRAPEAEPQSPDGLDAILNLIQGVAMQRAAASRGEDEATRLRTEGEALRPAIWRDERALALADLAYGAFNRVKTREIQAVFDALREDLVRFYDSLHPGEGHHALAVTMDPRKRGSSDLRMAFYERPAEDPRAFASEGHLDSLGLCLFLAFCKRFNGDWPLLVLDDVIASVDSLHKRRVATLLFREFGDRQLFLTTHDSRWFNDLRAAQAELGVEGVRNVIVQSWSLEGGPVLQDMPAVPPVSAASG